MKKEIILSQIQIENRIFTIRDQQVMIETKRVNEQVKRNLNRFLARFMLQLSREKWVNFQSQIATTKRKTILSQGVFFDGQGFDAYELACRIICSAKESIVLIDNYIDESTLTPLTIKELI